MGCYIETKESHEEWLWNYACPVNESFDIQKFDWSSDFRPLAFRTFPSHTALAVAYNLSEAEYLENNSDETVVWYIAPLKRIREVSDYDKFASKVEKARENISTIKSEYSYIIELYKEARKDKLFNDGTKR